MHKKSIKSTYSQLADVLTKVGYIQDEKYIGEKQGLIFHWFKPDDREKTTTLISVGSDGETINCIYGPTSIILSVQQKNDRPLPDKIIGVDDLSPDIIRQDKDATLASITMNVKRSR